MTTDNQPEWETGPDGLMPSIASPTGEEAVVVPEIIRHWREYNMSERLSCAERLADLGGTDLKWEGNLAGAFFSGDTSCEVEATDALHAFMDENLRLGHFELGPPVDPIVNEIDPDRTGVGYYSTQEGRSPKTHRFEPVNGSDPSGLGLIVAPDRNSRLNRNA